MEEENLSEEEGINDYKLGGYHPVYIGFIYSYLSNFHREVLANRYVIIEKVGWGHFSTVWIAKDFKHSTFVAIKV